MRHFKEYLDEKGKLQEKPVIDPKADTGPTPTKAPQTPDTKGKNWKSEVPLAGKPNDYAPATSPKKQQKYDKGLGDDGDKNLIYEPDVEGKNKEVSTWPKTKMENFIEKTKDLPLGEFTNLIVKEHKSEEKFPLGILKKANDLISENPTLMETFVREVKRNGAFDLLVKEMLNHNETIVEVAYQMAVPEGALMCSKLIESLQNIEFLDEVTDAPVSKTLVSKDDLEDKKKNKDLPKGKAVKSIDGNEVDDKMNGVVQTRDKITPEHNLINALLNNKNMMNQIMEYYK